MDIKICEFIRSVANKNIEIYNEFSLQHELGIYLRNLYPSKKIQFERNIEYFGLSKKEFPKKEIDIVVFDDIRNPDIAIEVKFPRNGRHPESMFDFCEDISFCEKLKNKIFKNTYAIVFAEDPLFYERGTKDGVYQYFRSQSVLKGTIEKPTGEGKGIKKHEIIGEYEITWKSVFGKLKYYAIKI